VCTHVYTGVVVLEDKKIPACTYRDSTIENTQKQFFIAPGIKVVSFQKGDLEEPGRNE
jgi:hypothetical protein